MEVFDGSRVRPKPFDKRWDGWVFISSNRFDCENKQVTEPLPEGLNEEEVITYARLRVRLKPADQKKLDTLIDSLLKRLAEPRRTGRIIHGDADE